MEEEIKDQNKENDLEEHKQDIPTPSVDEVIEDIKSSSEPKVEEAPKRRRGRPKKANEEVEEKPEVSEPEKKDEIKAKPQKEVKPTTNNSKQSTVSKKSSEKKSKEQTLILSTPTPFYVAKNVAKPKAKITGLVIIHAEDTQWREITATIKGFGKVHGFIRR